MIGYTGGLERDKLCAVVHKLRLTVAPIYTFGSHVITGSRFYAGRVYIRELGLFRAGRRGIVLILLNSTTMPILINYNKILYIYFAFNNICDNKS